MLSKRYVIFDIPILLYFGINFKCFAKFVSNIIIFVFKRFDNMFLVNFYFFITILSSFTPILANLFFITSFFIMLNLEFRMVRYEFLDILLN